MFSMVSTAAGLFPNKLKATLIGFSFQRGPGRLWPIQQSGLFLGSTESRFHSGGHVVIHHTILRIKFTADLVALLRVEIRD